MKPYSILLDFVRLFFTKTNNIFIFRKIGLGLYRLGILIAILIMRRKIGGIKSVYMIGAFDSNFVLGVSDIDLYIVTDDQPDDDGVKTIEKFQVALGLIIKYLPFIYVEHFFLSNFKKWDKICRPFIAKKSAKHWSRMTLIRGGEIRENNGQNEIEIAGYELRVCYEQILISIYQMRMDGKNNLRMMHNNLLCITRMFFIIKNKKDAPAICDYWNFLTTQGIEKEFIDELFCLPENNFQGDEELAILILFNAVKIIEKIGEEEKIGELDNPKIKIIAANHAGQRIKPEIERFVSRLEKNNIQSIYLTISPLGVDSSYVYLIFKNNLDYDSFKKQVRAVLDDVSILSTLRQKIKLAFRPFMYFSPPDIFPLIATEKMLGYGKFVNASYFFESANFKINGQKLFGAELEMALGEREMTKFPYFINLSSLHLSPLDIIITHHAIIYKLLSQKNIICLNDIFQEYENNFGPTDCDFNNVKERYIFTKQLIRENYDTYQAKHYNSRS